MRGILRKNCLRVFCVALILFTFTGVSARQEGEDFCCIRLVMFVPIAMPAQQESDASGHISNAWSSAINEFDTHDCPIEYEELSWEGRIELDKLVEAIGAVSGASADPKAREAFKNLLDVEYIWKGTLTLNRVDRIEKGYWEKGYMGKKNYVPQEAYGDWTLHMKLVNVHFDEVVKEGRASWSGNSTGGEMNRAVKDLARTVFSPVDDILFDYEKIPWKCKVEPEEDEISVGDSMSITIKDIKDSKGREPKPWQRIVVKLEKGEITNGTELGEEKSYAFLVGDGEVECEYKAPEDCKESGTEEVTVYNSCDWGQEWMRPLRVTLPQKEIGTGEFEITCDWEGTIASTGKIAEKGVGKGGESLLAIGLVMGEAQSEVTWELDVVFKLDRKNDRVKIYELKSAKFSFLDTTEGETKLEGEPGTMRSGGSWLAKVENRKLSPSECYLELIIDRKKKTYKIEGLLHVKNITEKVKGEFELDMPPLHGEEKDSGDQQVDYREEILIEGKFSGDSPVKLEGSREMKDDIPPEFMEFMEAFVGNVSGTIRWSLKQKGKQN